MDALQTLIVDESPSTRAQLKNLLEQNGALVEQTDSGQQALNYLKFKRPDVIFMDHTITDMSGLEAIKALRKNPNTADIPVILFSSQGNDSYRQQAMANGALDVIAKPINQHSIENALRNLWPHQEIAKMMDRQLESTRLQLRQELEVIVDQKFSSIGPGQSSLINLIHSVTDSKIHQLNLELRRQMTTKLDILLQDIQDEQRTLKQELLLQMDNKLSDLQKQNPTAWRPFQGWMNTWQVPTLIALVLGLLISWPK